MIITERHTNVLNVSSKLICIRSSICITQWKSTENREAMLGGRGGNFGLKMQTLTKVENSRHNLKTPSLKHCFFYFQEEFDTGLELNFVGTMDTSTYTQFQQPKIAEKY